MLIIAAVAINITVFILLYSLAKNRRTVHSNTDSQPNSGDIENGLHQPPPTECSKDSMWVPPPEMKAANSSFGTVFKFAALCVIVTLVR